MSRMDFTSLLYSTVHNREELINRLDGLLRTEYLTLTIIPFASELSPSECFRSYDNNRDFSCISSLQGLSLFSLIFNSPIKWKPDSRLDGKFFILEHPEFENTFVLMTVEPQEFVRRALMPFVERSYPRIYLTTINNQYMYSLLRRFRDTMSFSDLTVIRAVLRSRFAWQQGKKDNIIPSVSWPFLGLDGAFDYAHEQNGWFKSLTFDLSNNSRVYAEITITRNGIIKTNGEFQSIYNSLLLPVSETVYKNHELFRKRSRRDSPSLEVKPLTIDFGRDQFVDKEEQARLIEALRLLDKTSVSVIHNNPYLQLSITDYTDGSTFDLWIIDPKQLILVPQLKGTVPAIRRLVSHVFDNYAEGQVEDFSAVG